MLIQKNLSLPVSTDSITTNEEGHTNGEVSLSPNDAKLSSFLQYQQLISQAILTPEFF
jgi:hypothetical protein